jgi:hypothetical protein
MTKAKWTKPAKQDLKEIGLYIARQDRRPSVAAKILKEIDAKCNDYAEAFFAVRYLVQMLQNSERTAVYSLTNAG